MHFRGVGYLLCSSLVLTRTSEMAVIATTLCACKYLNNTRFSKKKISLLLIIAAHRLNTQV